MPSNSSDVSAAELRLQAILDTAVDAIITIDTEGIMESTNAATEKMFGYSEPELVGNNISLLMPSPYKEEHDNYIQRYLKTKVPHIIGFGREVTAMHRDGRTFPIDLAVTVLKIDGKTMFTGMIRDISDRRDAERRAQAHLDKLAHAGRLADLGLATSTIAHEVNQPLTAIVSYAHACLRLLKNEPLKSDLITNALEQMASQSERASTIVKRIHSMASKPQGNFEPILIKDIVEGVLSLLAAELRNHHVQVNLNLTDSSAFINADRIQIEQVLVNLIRNALQAMTDIPIEVRCIDIESTVDGDLVSMRVHDNGQGFDKATASQIFESFYSTKDSGMGMGLSISRSLIEAHGGQLWAQSNPGNGATFYFELPVYQ